MAAFRIPFRIQDLDDVDFSTFVDGDFISYDGTSKKFVGATGTKTVTNSDGSLTANTSAGDVTISLNTAHANTWTGIQTFSNDKLVTDKINTDGGGLDIIDPHMIANGASGLSLISADSDIARGWTLSQILGAASDGSQDTIVLALFTGATGFFQVDAAGRITAQSPTFQDATDNTKAAIFDLSNITTGNSRTVNVPDANSTLAQAKSSSSHQFLTAMSAQGLFSSAQPAFTDIFGIATPAQGGFGLDVSGVAKGGLIVGSGSGTFGLFPVGTDGFALVADSTQTLGVKWLSLTTSPGGSSGQLQYNSGAFGGISGATSDGTNVTFGSGNLLATLPKITTGISDASGNKIIGFTPTASAVDYVNFTNGAAGSPGVVGLSAMGSDTNISLTLAAKGTGQLKFTYHTDGDIHTDSSGNLWFKKPTGGGIFMALDQTNGIPAFYINAQTTLGNNRWDIRTNKSTASTLFADILRLTFNDDNNPVYPMGVGYQQNNSAPTSASEAWMSFQDDGGAVDFQVDDTGYCQTNSLQAKGALWAVSAATPVTPSVAVHGTGGSTTWGYKVVYVLADGTTVSGPGLEGKTTVGNATLSSSNFNRVTWPPLDGSKFMIPALKFKLYRTTAGTSPSTTGLIFTSTANNAAGQTFDDTGVSADGSVPSNDQTGLIGGRFTKTGSFTVSQLPTAAAMGAGTRALVTDSTATLSAGLGNTVAGAGSNIVPVFSDGTNWIIG